MQHCLPRYLQADRFISHSQCFFPTTGRSIVECQFFIIMSFRTHQGDQSLPIGITSGEQELLKTATEVETVDTKRFLN